MQDKCPKSTGNAYKSFNFTCLINVYIKCVPEIFRTPFAKKSCNCNIKCATIQLSS